MNLIYAATGGRPRHNDDLLLVQSETQTALKGLYTGQGAFIINGCVVSGAGPYNISSGLIYCDEQIQQFDAVSGITFPYFIYSNTVQLTNPMPYKSGGTQPTRQLYKAIGSTSTPVTGQYVTMSLSGGKTWQNTQSYFVAVTGTQTVNGNKTFNGNNTLSGANNFTGSNTFTGSFNVNSSGNIVTTGAGTFNNGITITSAVANLNSNKIINLANGSSNNDAVNVGQLNSEASNRTSADNTLQSNINTVSTALSTETSNRTTADTSLQSQISAINSVPSGVILMWSGSPSGIPLGWKLCDGTNSTPDLRGRFIVGYSSVDSDYSTVGNTGGEKKHTLVTAELPSHNHSINDPAHSHYFPTHLISAPGGGGWIPTDGVSNNVNGPNFYVQPSYTGISINNTGSNFAHENRPNFYTLCYIQKS